MWLIWLLGLFSAFFTLGYATYDQSSQATRSEYSAIKQRAQQTVSYLNTINDWLYLHPDMTHGVIPDKELGFSGGREIKHVLDNGRVFVYQKNQPGLFSALLEASHASALLGTIKNRRMIDRAGNDMGVNVPAGFAPIFPDARSLLS